jgi:SAM-dependent methyltransferase
VARERDAASIPPTASGGSVLDFEGKAYAEFVTSWLLGIDNEVQFWDEFLSTHGGPWPQDYQRRTMPSPPSRLEAFAAASPTWPLRVLDVGAGPISNLGIATSRGPLDLHACDALAGFYQELLERLELRPYVITSFALVERLTDVFAEESFDVVWMENALDHSFDPFLGLAEMLRVAKHGGSVLLTHVEDEAERESYHGFHQWNITQHDGRLRIWRRRHSHFVDEVFAPFAEVTATREQVGDLSVIRGRLVKRAHPPRPPQALLAAYDALVLDAAQRRAQAPSQARDMLELTQLRAQVQGLRASVSWRLTAPLRALGRAGRRVLG